MNANSMKGQISRSKGEKVKKSEVTICFHFVNTQNRIEEAAFLPHVQINARFLAYAPADNDA